mmetsp:Transcript_30576/g.65918  ORF Transcript_30576/g.65918 Transcript_30576/m.65918 type:complete len:202 (+) Transcript_30576:1769-2374(+)
MHPLRPIPNQQRQKAKPKKAPLRLSRSQRRVLKKRQRRRRVKRRVRRRRVRRRIKRRRAKTAKTKLPRRRNLPKKKKKKARKAAKSNLPSPRQKEKKKARAQKTRKARPTTRSPRRKMGKKQEQERNLRPRATKIRSRRLWPVRTRLTLRMALRIRKVSIGSFGNGVAAIMARTKRRRGKLHQHLRRRSVRSAPRRATAAP